MVRLKRPLFLVSASPRRRELLQKFGIPFKTLPSPGDKPMAESVGPAQHCKAQALHKAFAACGEIGRGLVLGCDTLVFAHGKIFGKPASERDSRRMLKALSGRSHRVYTGMALVSLPENKVRVGFQITRVRFRPLAALEINKYIKSGEPSDKAGAYGIQESGALFVSGIHGCFFNVAGLPVELLMKFLQPFVLH